MTTWCIYGRACRLSWISMAEFHCVFFSDFAASFFRFVDSIKNRIAFPIYFDADCRVFHWKNRSRFHFCDYLKISALAFCTRRDADAHERTSSIAAHTRSSFPEIVDFDLLSLGFHRNKNEGNRKEEGKRSPFTFADLMVRHLIRMSNWVAAQWPKRAERMNKRMRLCAKWAASERSMRSKSRRANARSPFCRCKCRATDNERKRRSRALHWN